VPGFQCGRLRRAPPLSLFRVGPRCMDFVLAERIGSTARTARIRAELTQADVAERLDMAPEVYGRLERGLMLPSVVTLRSLCLALAVSADELLGLREADPSEDRRPHPGYYESPEVRRLVRRINGLARRKVRLLILLAAALDR